VERRAGIPGAGLSRFDARYADPDLEQPLGRLPSGYFGTNIAITTTGVFSHAALIAAIQAVGIDNMMFSIDYRSSRPAAQAVIRNSPITR
jgi:2,3-dihydroxybenzoate decarboxylase